MIWAGSTAKSSLWQRAFQRFCPDAQVASADPPLGARWLAIEEVLHVPTLRLRGV